MIGERKPGRGDLGGGRRNQSLWDSTQRNRHWSRVLGLCVALTLVTPATSWAGARDGFNNANRTFNFWMLDYLLEPVARGYNFVVPKWGQAGVRNALQNLERPRDVVASLMQGKMGRAGNHFGALLIDTTIGIGGLMRPSERWLHPEEPETINETLGVWGVPDGPFLILPVLGESCPRCLVGGAVDTVLYPLFWIQGRTGTVSTATIATAGARGLGAINFLARQMPKRGAAKEEWVRYEEILNERPTLEEAERLFIENLEADVAN